MRSLKIFLAVFTALLLLLPLKANAAPAQSYMEYMAAWASTAVYGDKLGLLAQDVMKKYGWKINSAADGRVLLAQKNISGENIYLTAIRGTSSLDDVKTDLSTGSAVFGGRTPEEFAAAMQDEDLANTKPLVHSGFIRDVQDEFFTSGQDGSAIGETLARTTHEQDAVLYLTGHSLGGAEAELLAARLIDMGADRARLHVISFGAPAVGNKVFVDKYEPQMNLTRITMAGDPVKNLAQIANDKFVQFNARTRWTLPYSEADKFAHGMLLYFDRAMCGYYDEQNMKAVNEQPDRIDALISFSFDFPAELSGSEKYIQAAIMDGTDKKSVIVPTGERDMAALAKQADELKAQYIVCYDFHAQKIKDNTSNRRYYINAAKYVYDDHGRLISGGSAGADTNTMTVVQAALYAAYFQQ